MGPTTAQVWPRPPAICFARVMNIVELRASLLMQLYIVAQHDVLLASRHAQCSENGDSNARWSVELVLMGSPVALLATW